MSVDPAPRGRSARLMAWVRHPLGLGLWVACTIALAVAAYGINSLLDARRWRQFPTAPCHFLASGVVPVGEGRYSVQVLYEYEVAGTTYVSDRYSSGRTLRGDPADQQKKLDAVVHGDQGVCRYDPDRPARSTLVVASDGIVLIFVPFVLLVYAVLRMAAIQRWWRDRTQRRQTALDRVWSQPGSRTGQALRRAALPGLCLLMGGGFLFGCVGWPLWRLWQGRDRVAVPCTIASSGVETVHMHNGTRHEMRFAYRYVWDGQERTGKDLDYTVISFRPLDEAGRLTAGHPPGSSATAWVRPAAPDDAVLERAVRLDPFSIGIGLLMAGGGIFLARIQLIRARRDRGAWTRSAGAPRRTAAGEPPTVLPGAPGSWAPWLGLVLVAVCGATGAWYLPGTIAMARAGAFDVVMLFAVGAVVGGVVGAVFTWRWLSWLRGGRPRLALAGPPPCPGALLRLEWTLDGAAADRRWTLELEQEEQGPVTKVTASQHGTMLEDRQERRSVRRQPFVTLSAGQRHGACDLRIPADAAPSFDLAGWAVVWQVLAVDERGRCFRFPFVVVPHAMADLEGA